MNAYGFPLLFNITLSESQSDAIIAMSDISQHIV